MTQELSNNVVEFPKNKIVRDSTQNIEELKKIKTKSLENFADALAQEITENVLMDLDNSGLDTESRTFTKDFHFLVNVLTATIYRMMELEHELHQFIDERVKLVKVDVTDELDNIP